LPTASLEPFVTLARTLRKHCDGILAAIELNVSNGRMEGINNKIGVIKHRAYGSHSASALIAMIFSAALTRVFGRCIQITYAADLTHEAFRRTRTIPACLRFCRSERERLDLDLVHSKPPYMTTDHKV
jgi:hypothetical protein